MSIINEITKSSNRRWPEARQSIQIQFDSEPQPPIQIIESLASLPGEIDLYCWYEGQRGLPVIGAEFMKNYLLKPLYEAKKRSKS